MHNFRFCIILSALVLAACSASDQIAMRDPDQIADNFLEMGEAAAAEKPADMFIEPSRVAKKRQQFMNKLKALGSGHPDTRKLFESYIDEIGANGVLDGIETLWPKCHGEAHDLGKIIYAKTQDMALGLQICADGCYSGCMHGVLMEAFSTAQNPDDPSGHVDVEIVKTMMKDLCFKNDTMTSSYSQGDCAHGVGHAMMVLADYEIADAIDLCDAFEHGPMNYYCATGAYMEYVNANDPKEAFNKPLFFPCDQFKYPAACARYKIVHVAPRMYRAGKTTEDIRQECKKLTGDYRIGCFHGLGNAHLSPLLDKKISLAELCLGLTPEEEFVCIEGAMERMGKYHEEKALALCETLVGRPKEICLASVENKMYDMEKDLHLYIRGWQ